MSRVLLLMLFAAAIGASVIRVDYLVAGLGPGGISFMAQMRALNPNATMLGYDLDDELFGNCNTVPIPAGEVPPGPYPSWQDIGTSSFENSALYNALYMQQYNVSKGPFAIDSVAFADSYVPGIVQFFNPTQLPAPTTYYQNFADPAAQSPFPFFQYGLQTPTADGEQAFGEAIGRLFGLEAKYPFLATYEWPDPLPEELLQDFGITMEQYDLAVLDSLITQVNVGELDYKRLPTMYVLAELPPTLLGILGVFPLPADGPQLGFVLAGGCARLYNAMADAIGREKLLTSTTLKGDMSRSHGRDGWPIRATLRSAEGAERVVLARNFVIAHALTAETGRAYALDSTELDALAGLTAPNLYALQVDIQGPPASLPNGYLFLNYDLLAPLPDPRVEYFQRALPYGPAASIVISSRGLSADQVGAVVDSAMATLKAVGVATNYTVLAEDPHPVFGPQFGIEQLRASPNGYSKLAAIQGRRSTYHLGSHMTGSPDTVDVWNRSLLLARRLLGLH